MSHVLSDKNLAVSPIESRKALVFRRFAVLLGKHGNMAAAFGRLQVTWQALQICKKLFVAVLTFPAAVFLSPLTKCCILTSDIIVTQIFTFPKCRRLYFHARLEHLPIVLIYS